MGGSGTSSPNGDEEGRAHRRRDSLFITIAEDFTLYASAFRACLHECDASGASRIERVLTRFAAATQYDDDGNQVDTEHPGSPDTLWDDPEDAAVAFVMAANWEAIQSIEPALIDYFALREGPAFVADALFRTWAYRFRSYMTDTTHWVITRLADRVHATGTLRAAAWEHLRSATRERRQRATRARVANDSFDETMAAAKQLLTLSGAESGVVRGPSSSGPTGCSMSWRHRRANGLRACSSGRARTNAAIHNKRTRAANLETGLRPLATPTWRYAIGTVTISIELLVLALGRRRRGRLV